MIVLEMYPVCPFRISSHEAGMVLFLESPLCELAQIQQDLQCAPSSRRSLIFVTTEG